MFDMKVTTIEEAQDVYKMKVYEFVGSLQMFDMTIDDISNKKRIISTMKTRRS